MNRFFERGGAWVIAQMAIIVAILLLAVRFPGSGHSTLSAVGALSG